MINQSILSSSTTTNKSENQDFHDSFAGQDFNALFVADGLGSFRYSKLASEKTIEFFKKNAEAYNSSELTGKNRIKFDEVFKKAKEALVEFAKRYLEDNPPTSNKYTNLFGTTLIAVYETETKILIAYVGNGAIWHIRGNYNEFPKCYHFPWNAANYLNPHSIPQDGKEAIYRLISDDEDIEDYLPSVVEIQKDRIHGDIIMICTDGIYSADQVSAGKNDKGIWVKYPETMLSFFEYLTNFFNSKENQTKELLFKFLSEYLTKLKPKFDDDATIGVMITSAAIEYQKKQILKSEVNQSKEV